MTDESVDAIHECAETLKKTIEKMGGTQVAIIYVYTAPGEEEGESYVNSGFSADGLVSALGAVEYSRAKLTESIVRTD